MKKNLSKESESVAGMQHDANRSQSNQNRLDTTCNLMRTYRNTLPSSVFFFNRRHILSDDSLLMHINRENFGDETAFSAIEVDFEADDANRKQSISNFNVMTKNA